MQLLQIKKYVEDYLLNEFNENIEDLQIIREISLKELSEMDYFEGNSDKKPKNFKALKQKYYDGFWYNHCEIFGAKCPCYEVLGKFGKYCFSKRILELKNNNWSYKLTDKKYEEKFINIIISGNSYSSKKIMNEFNNFLDCN